MVPGTANQIAYVPILWLILLQWNIFIGAVYAVGILVYNSISECKVFVKSFRIFMLDWDPEDSVGLTQTP